MLYQPIIGYTAVSLYNTLSIIETKGENTIIMGKCLEELSKYIKTLQSQNDGEEE